jgi:hypothetical protein
MLIHEAITKALEGGYTTEHLADASPLVQAHYFLETSFWEALARALGWEGDFEYIQLSSDVPRKMRQPMWLYYWHRFNSHLVAGNTPASFLPIYASHPLALLPSIPPLQCRPLQKIHNTTGVSGLLRQRIYGILTFK